MSDDLTGVFDKIYRDNHWKNRESRSGGGSTLHYTVNLRHQLPFFARRFGIKTFFDAPCGDLNWMRKVEFKPGISYIGGDVSSEVIARLEEEKPIPDGRYLHFDITRDPFPDADVWFCRDCWFHLPLADILKALENFCRSGVRYLFTTTHLNISGFRNKDMAAGGFRLIDLFSEPFMFPPQVAFRIADYIFPFPPREMCVWTREEIAALLPDLRRKIAGA
ncbi:class I SAM-dependent methyltransferase [Falsiroseomonas sp. CW058]|uniref:class I SAM-dependent methyltransferase n=1 Tax=Falsiroseomonas sp. CW058 TaxID=3388664 RepID=UPI003D3193E8